MYDTAEGEELVPQAVWKYFGFRTSEVNQEEIIRKECLIAKQHG